MHPRTGFGSLTLLLGVCAPAAFGQTERVEWLRANAVEVRTIDPADEDFSDLMPLKEMIGTARVVALGEQSHGDGACFAAKHRLIRFLHREMGFDVLAWESGMFDCRLVEEALREGVPSEEAWTRGIFPIFGRSPLVVSVVEYARTTHGTPRPLEIAGFDCQFSNTAAPMRLPIAVRDFVVRADAALEGSPLLEAVDQLCAGVFAGNAGPVEGEVAARRARVEALIDLIDERAGDFATVHAPRDVAFLRRALRNLLVFDALRRQGQVQGVADNNMRDERMGENLAWLADEHFAGRKIIVWAASFHTMRHPATIDTRLPHMSYEGLVTMGHVAHDLLGDDYYSIMFTAYDGRAGNPFSAPRDLPVSSEGSLEALLHEAGLERAIVDLRGLDGDHWLRERLVSRPLGYAEMEASWPACFDAVFHTDTMFPATEEGTRDAG